MNILKNFELDAVELDVDATKQPEGYFASYRSIGLPIHPVGNTCQRSALGTKVQMEQFLSCPGTWSLAGRFDG